MKTRDQEFATSAFEQIDRDVAGKNEAYRKKYGAMAHKLPVLIRAAGLAQSLAFVTARGSEEGQKLLEHVAATVGVADLPARSRSAELVEYMRLTRQTLAAMLWYKRFAQSMLGVDASEETDEGGER